ncbi:MAG: diguanylate cyclase domain-containing protein [Verrucomicrobiota bacterium]
MTTSFLSRKWTALIPPLILLCAIHIFLIAGEMSLGWHRQPFWQYIPYIICGLVVIFAAFFGPSRLLFVSLLWIVIIYFIQPALIGDKDAARAEVLIILSSVYAAPFAALFYHIPERGFFSVNTLINALVVVSVGLVMFLLGAGASENAAGIAGSPLLLPVSSWFRISRLGALNMAVCIPFLLIRRKHESPMTGPIIVIGLFFVAGALNFRSSLWSDEVGTSAFLMFGSGAQICVLWGLLESLWRNAYTDELTGLPGRRSLRNHLSNVGLPYAVALADIDRFKKINDKHGHDVGDQALRFTASQLSRASAGTVYRYGGEEFVIVYEQIAKEEAAAAGEELRQAVASRQFVLRGRDRPRKKPSTRRPDRKNKPGIKITVSIGIAFNDDAEVPPYEIMQKADKAMYAAKKAGRNKAKAV